jgi:DNA phosphorothioation-dependent restriction protein DptG
MSIINLDTLSAKVDSKNASSSYMPVRTNHNDCDWDSVSALFISSALGIELKNYSIEEFESDCEVAFKEKLNKEPFWDVLKKAYFEKQDIFKIEPHCLMLNANTELTKPADQRVATVLRSLLGTVKISFVDHQLNFIEEIFVHILKKHCKECAPLSLDEPYLPFIADHFKIDLVFLASHPKYFLEQLPSFLALYTFLYTSQLALNLPEWHAGVPKPKPLYFILDTEKASSERTEIKQSGWDSFKDATEIIFPLLSMLEVLQLANLPKKPLWKIAAELKECQNDSIYKDALKDYTLRFQENRRIVKDIPEGHTALDWMQNLLELGHDQFNKRFADPTSTRYQANQKVVAGIKDYIAEGFVQNRRRGGNVLVLTQDNLLLLTNIAIGFADRLRLVELIEAFESRGVFFDKQTQQVLVDFYERIGNVERMSDSGEAVYVRRTI